MKKPTVDLAALFAPLSPKKIWLKRYLSFVGAAAKVEGPFDRHHILPRSLFPEFKSFVVSPWNRVDLSPANHVIAHYLLYRALPSNPYTRTAFRFMVGRLYAALVLANPSEDLVREIAAEYQLVRESGNVLSIKGWVRIYKEPDRATAVPAEELEHYLQHGWSQEFPKREWMFKGKVSRRVPLEHVEEHKALGFALGRPPIHTEESKAKTRHASLTRNQRFPGRDWSADCLRGEKHRLFGKTLPAETCAKISQSLTGLKQSMETIARRRVSILAHGPEWGKVRKAWWTPERREGKSIAQMGEGNNRFGLEGHWKGKTRPAESVEKMKATVQKNLLERPEIYNKNKPRGEDHWTHGKPRDVETCSKISQSLTGKIQSDETKIKRAQALAITNLPSFTAQEEAQFRALILAETPDDRAILLKRFKGVKLRDVALGIMILLENRQEQELGRYWRRAEAWIKLRSRLAHRVPALG